MRKYGGGGKGVAARVGAARFAAGRGGVRRKRGNPSGAAAPPPPFAPKRPFGTFRCCAWLFFRKEHTMLFSPKRSCFRFAALTLRVSSRPKPPLCKGRWHSEAVTEGLPLSGKFPRKSPLPSQPLVFLQMLGQGVEVGALFGLRPEDAQGLKGRAARGRQRCCRASGGCADCRRSGRRAQEGNPSVRCADTSPLRTETPLRDVPVLRMAFFPKRAYDALFSKTHMLQVRCAHPTGVFAPEASPV